MRWNQWKKNAVIMLLAVAVVGLGAVTVFALASGDPPGIDDTGPPPSKTPAPAAGKNGKKDDAAKPIPGLVLTLSTKVAKTVLRANGDSIEPIPLTVAFTNAGQKPLRIDFWDFPWRNLHVEVKGPDAASVKIKATSFVREKQLPPRHEDFPLLKPGESWSSTIDVNSPFLDKLVSLRKPGTYFLKLVYTNTKAINLDFAEPVSVGTLTSNEIRLEVRAAGAAKD